MEITITEIETPMFNEFTVFENIDFKSIAETKTLTIACSNETKTRIHTSLKIGSAQKGLNWKIDGFKTHEEEKMNFFTYDKTIANYFVVSKKQNKEVYFEYLKSLILEVFRLYNIPEIDKLEVAFINRFNNWK